MPEYTHEVHEDREGHVRFCAEFDANHERAEGMPRRGRDSHAGLVSAPVVALALLRRESHYGARTAL